MANNVAVIERDNNQIDTSDKIDLRKFAPKLRKLGKFLIESDTPMTMKAACDFLNLNYGSVCSLVYKEKAKGNDFHEFIKQASQSLLSMSRVAVHQAVVRGAVSDAPSSYQDRRTYLQLSGDLKESSTDINIGTLTVGINATALPADNSRDKGVIDVEPYIPSDE